MERRFGRDFSQVRVHTGAQAEYSATALDARAYTVGSHIVFGSEHSDSSTTAKRRLLAHELTHVVQQSSAAPAPGNDIRIDTNSGHETNANRVADAVVNGTADIGFDVANYSLQREGTAGPATQDPSAGTPTTHSCIEEVVGEDIPSLLQAGVVTIIEFGSESCGPCRQNKRALEAICRSFTEQPPPVTVRFYSVDTLAEGNEGVADQYTGSSIPHLYFYVGSTEKAHYNTGIEPDAMKRIVAEHVSYAATSGAARGALKGMRWGALAGGVAGIGGAIAAGADAFGKLEGNDLMGAILGSIGGGALAGGLLGAGIGALVGALGDDRKRGPRQQKRRRLQPKRRTSTTSDPQEREADAWGNSIADQNGNVRFTSPDTSSMASDGPGTEDWGSSNGRAMDPSTRRLMESQFGRDFSHVRIHQGAAAHALTNSMDAYAVTMGTDIYFAADGYSPATRFGRRILGHELAHVAQNEACAAKAPEARLEAEATHAAARITEGRQAAVQLSSDRPALALTRRQKRTLAGMGIGTLAGGAGGALIGLGVASQMSGQPFGAGAAIGGAIGGVAGLITGGLIGYLSRRTSAVEAPEAEVAIRRRFGAYLPGGVGALNNAVVHPVNHAELCMWHRCRFGEDAPCGDLRGWTDTGREPPNEITSAEAEPICSNNQRLEHATPQRPVIYFDKDRRDAGLMVHEGVHAYAHPSFGQQMRNGVSEGTTEYFTRQILDDLNMARGNVYEEELNEVTRLVPIVGEEKLRRGYFMGEMDPLRQTADQLLGPCALTEWAFAVQTLNFDRNKPRQIIEGRHQNYCPEGEASGAAPPESPAEERPA